MNEIAIIIPSRLSARRLPKKPLKKIAGKEMIVHVYQAAKRSKTKNVIVATPDKEIFRLVKSVGGDAIITQNNHKTGTDRIFEVYKNKLKKNQKLLLICKAICQI